MSIPALDAPSIRRRSRAYRALLLVVVLCALLQPAMIRAAVDQTVPLSVSGELDTGAHAEYRLEGNQHISADGRFVAFASFGENLVPGQVDTNGRRDVFLYDRELDSMQLVSHSTAGLTTAANGQSLTEAMVSADGAWVLFNSESTDLIAGVSEGNTGSDVFLWERATGAVTLVSHSTAGATTTGDEFSSLNSISDDGAYVTFQTTSADMVVGATTNIFVDVFLWERATGNVTLISHTSASPTTEGNNFSFGSQISGDGAWVAFESGATDLISGGSDTNFSSDLFLWERATGTISLISHAEGAPTTTGSSFSSEPSVSNDAAFIAFRSFAANLVSGDANSTGDIFLFERATGTISLVSQFGGASGNGASSEPRLSGDGSWVAFMSAATDLVGGIDTNSQDDLFLYDSSSGTVTLVSHALGSPTTAANNRSSAPTVADDGSWVSYLSRATDIVGATDANGRDDVFLFEQATGQNTLVSHTASSASIAGDRRSDTPALAANGAAVFFQSEATDLVADVTYGPTVSVFFHDRVSGVNEAVSRVDFGQLPFTANSLSSAPSISDDGRFVTFLSEALDLVPDQQDVRETQDVFFYDSLTGRVTLVSHVPGSSVTTGTQEEDHDPLDRPVISGDGEFVVFQSYAPDLVGGSDTNDDPDLFAWERATGAVSLISHAAGSMTTAGNNISGDAAINTDGTYVVFETRATDLGFAEDNFSDDIYRWERATGTLTLVSHAFGSATTGSSYSRDPVISGDGSIVGFISFSNNLVSGLSDSNLGPDVYSWEASNGLVRLVGHIPGSSNDTPDDFGSSEPAVSRDGAWLAFKSNSEELVPGIDTNSGPDIFLWERAGGLVRLVSHVPGAPATAGNNWSEDPVIGDDGTYITFTSRSTDLRAGITDTNNNFDVYQWHSASDTATLISHVEGNPSTAGNGTSSEPTMSGDGAWVAYKSFATNLITGSDTNASTDIFRWDRATNESTLVSHKLGEVTTAGAGPNSFPAVSRSGAFVAFSSRADDLVADDYGNTDVFLFGDDLDTDLSVSVSVAPEPVGLGWEVTWTIDVTNNGPGAASRVLVRDSLPAGVTFSGAEGMDWNCNIQVGTVACMLLGLEAGEMAPTLEISGIAPGTPGMIDNTVTVTSAAVDLSPLNDSDSVESIVQGLPPRVVEVKTDPNAETLDECRSTSQMLDGLTLTFSQTMSNPPGTAGSADDMTDPNNYQLVSAGPDRDLQTVACGAAAGDDVVIAVTQVTANGSSTEALLEPASSLGDDLYRVFACATLADDLGFGLDGDGDGFSGGDFSRQLRVDTDNLLTDGALDCNLDSWWQLEEDAAEVAHNAADINDASASGSARAMNLTADELGLFQCLQTQLPELNLQASVRVEDAIDLVGRFECAGYDQLDCSGLLLGEDSAETSLDENPGVWVGLSTGLTVPAGASTLCGFTLWTPGGLAFEVLVDDLVAREALLFTDGFESGDTSAWSGVIP